MKLIRHFKRWNLWRKNCVNGWTHKLLVLIGLQHSPTYELYLLEEEVEAMMKPLTNSI